MALGGGDKSNSLFIKIAEAVKGMLTRTAREEGIAKIIASKQLEKENLILAQLHEAIIKQQQEVKKLTKPPTGWDPEGKEVERLRTKDEHEAKKKAEDRLDKMMKAYEKGCETGDVSDANNFIQQSGGKDKGTKEGEVS